jgi:hypothetical protein
MDIYGFASTVYFVSVINLHILSLMLC